MLLSMISSLRGRVLERSVSWVLVEVSGLGYRIGVSPSTLGQIPSEGEVFLYVHHHVREDAETLFGFLTMDDLELFEKLLTISGVGPKSAMTIMAVGSAEQVRKAIMSGDLAMLTSVPGVGKKTAQKIILELKGQLVEAESGEHVTANSDVIDALVGLGYSTQQAKDVLKHVTATDPADKIREALKYLSKA